MMPCRREHRPRELRQRIPCLGPAVVVVVVMVMVAEGGRWCGRDDGRDCRGCGRGRVREDGK